jgi:hypothetical protein
MDASQPTTAIQAFRSFEAWASRSPLSAHVRRETADVELYRSLFESRGASLPVDFEAFLSELGRVEIDPIVEVDGFGDMQGGGLAIVTPFELIDWYDHLDAAIHAGVHRAEGLIVFCDTAAAHDGAWAFDFQRADTDAFVGHYNQDAICMPEAQATPLPFGFASFDELITEYLGGLRSALEGGGHELQERIAENVPRLRERTDRDRVESFLRAHPPATDEPMPQPPVLEDLAEWLSTHPGNQRAMLAELNDQWGERLRSAPEVRNQLARIIRRAIKSPKLKDARDAFIATLD